ncbi:hypothetical protein EXIGLDRAFT_727652 [Exidia glandulosa HHB12029]|uniref:Uncharacterized protein n=1 Tax=Exidia glandulosa HHB12029 TaxID=1314781 RepID=A0A165M057_EXIGL|nr:hypothetical protein EXIGLDRAFT_727652 [Exidia glandulosa HHB12029]
MDRTRQLPVELWEQIIRTFALSYRLEQKQPLVELTHLCWSLAVAARPTLYRTVFVSVRNVHCVCERIDQDADAFRTWTRGLWMLDHVSPTHAAVLSSGFANITALGGNPYNFPTFNSLLRPRLVVLDAFIWAGDWRKVYPAIYPVLSHVEHLRLGITSIGRLESRALEIPAEVVVVDLIVTDGLRSYFNSESSISLVRAFLNEPALRRLQINLDITAREHIQAFHDALQGINDPRLTVQYQEVVPTSSGDASIPRILHSRHLRVFEEATASRG